MKQQYAWLFALGAVATVLSFPFPPPWLQLAVGLIVIALLVFAGLWFGARVDLGSRKLSLARAAWSLLIGAAMGLLVLALLPIAGLQSRIIKESTIPVWKWLIIAFDSAVLEELIFRLFLMSLVTWLFVKWMRRENAIRIALVVSALAFGAAHLNRWLDSGPWVIAAVMIVNGLLAVVLGRLYVVWGIESAILGHFAGDVIVHIVGPHFFAKGSA